MKRLVIVGNKVIQKDISQIVDSFDVVVRLNRMNNFGMTGKRIDYLLVDPHRLFFNMVFDEKLESDESRHRFKLAKNLIFNMAHYRKNYFNPEFKYNQPNKYEYGEIWQNENLEKLFTKEQLETKQVFAIKNYNRLDFYKEIQNKLNYRPCTSFRLICHYIENFLDQYEIYITGLDVFDRRKMAKTMPDILSTHARYMEYEEFYLKKFVNENKIKVIEC